MPWQQEPAERNMANRDTVIDPPSLTGECYELIDFGEGRKLERFGSVVLDRPCPAAEHQPIELPERWSEAVSRYERLGDSGRWVPIGGPVPAPWEATWDPLTVRLKCTPFGHVGLFPEQVANWRWIARRVGTGNRPCRVLNLFAYTGVSTLFAAAAGAQVVHVDAAKNVVQWARDNARLSGLGEAPIRWIVEDARRFVQRELRRGNRYEAIVLDPPSYGHGPKGERWQIDRDLVPLVQECAALLDQERRFFLLSCHSPSWGPSELSALLQETLSGSCQATAQTHAGPLTLVTAEGRPLAAGVTARWPVR